MSQKIQSNFSGAWAMQRQALETMLATDISSLNLPDDDGDDYFNADDDAGYTVSPNGVAIIELTDTLVKHESLWTMFFGGTSTANARVAVMNADADPQVKSILLYIDSPGGSVFGTSDLADAVANCSKTVVAYCSDMACSAAYEVASQADVIYSNPTGLIGSIGTYMVMYDTSKAYEEAGVKAYLITTGEYKGAGADGVPITDAQLEDEQRLIDSYNADFIAKISQGRGMSIEGVKKLATGQCWLAPEAKALGLIDGIDSIENVLEMGNTMGKSIKANGKRAGIRLAKKEKNNSSEVSTSEQPLYKEEPGNSADSKEVVSPEAEAQQGEEMGTPSPEGMLATLTDKPQAKAEEVAVVETSQEVTPEAAVAVEPKAETKAAEVVEAIDASAIKEGEKSRLQALMNLCKGDAKFAVEQFIKGNSTEQAAVEYVAVLEKALAAKGTGAKPVAVKAVEEKEKEAQASKPKTSKELAKTVFGK